MDHFATAHPLYGRIPGLRRWLTMLPSLRSFDNQTVAQERLRIIKFYRRYGEEATKEAFGADRKVISRWQRRLTQAKGRLGALSPRSTKPHHYRTSQTDPRIIEWLKQERATHHRVGKAKLKPDLDLYCQTLGIRSISASTIGKELKRYQYFHDHPSFRVYHQPYSKWYDRARRAPKRLRIKYAPHPDTYGHILSDTVEKVIDGTRRYFMSAIDAKLKFALTLEYPSVSSANMQDFYERFKAVYPLAVKVWQSDNGPENLGIFDQELTKDQIPHLFIYPRCPKIDTFIERYNRTIQEEYLDYHLDELIDLRQGNRLLANWNVYYNTQRRHHSLGLVSPVQYLIEKGDMSQMSATSTISIISM